MTDSPTGSPPPDDWDVVIVIDGDPPRPGWGRLIAPGARVIAADGGARHARREHVRVTDLIGDLDTLDDGEVGAIEDAGAVVHRFDPDKDFTDFELAARLAGASAPPGTVAGPPGLLVVGGAGGRVDHALGNIAVLTGRALAGFAITALLGDAVAAVADPRRVATTRGPIGSIVSLVPFAGPARGVSTTGLRYELADEDLSSVATRGISNVIRVDPATVSVGAGSLLVVEPGAYATLLERGSHDTEQGEPR